MYWLEAEPFWLGCSVWNAGNKFCVWGTHGGLHPSRTGWLLVRLSLALYIHADSFLLLGPHPPCGILKSIISKVFSVFSLHIPSSYHNLKKKKK